MSIVIGPLEAFYIAGSILLLVVAILIYPNLKDYSKNHKKDKSKK